MGRPAEDLAQIAQDLVILVIQDSGNPQGENLVHGGMLGQATGGRGRTNTPQEAGRSGRETPGGDLLPQDVLTQ